MQTLGATSPEPTHNPMLINEADKGSTIVVQDRSEYIAVAMKHLNDKTTQKPLRENNLKT